ncbi:MAG: CCA tRNA nucleotidyltransferase [Ginsengibacter sp.]
MEIRCTEEEVVIFKKISEAARKLQMPAFVIGGFVRDQILGRPTKDADIVCEGDGIELANETAAKFFPKPHVSFFKNFGTAQIRILLGDSPFEIEFVGARKESYNRGSRKPDVLPGTLEEDRMRRDFTINTLAADLDKDNFLELIDPLNGLEDIENKIIKTPLPPDQTFIDDPLRMMRAIRFATQLKFEIEPKTFQAIRDNKERIKIVSGERIIDELNKIVMADKPSVGFDLLYKSGLLKIIFPQMVALVGAEFIDGKGHKDNFYHTLQVLDNISEHTNDLWLRWAAILHDIAKPATKKFEDGHGWTFHGHEVVGGRMVPKIFAQLKLPLNEKMKFVRKMVELHLRPISLTKENITDSAIRRLLVDAGDDLECLMMLCKADITSKNKMKVRRYLANFGMVENRLKEVEEADHLRNWQPPITGEIIMKEFGLPPSRMVGEIKNAVREAILDGEIPNDFNAAFDYMKKVAQDMGVK